MRQRTEKGMQMAKFKILVTQTVEQIGWFEVEADSLGEALDNQG